MELHSATPKMAKPVEIRGVLDLYNAQELRETLAQHLLTESSLTLDLSGVEECGAVALQLFCSARKTAQDTGKTFAVVSGSPAVDQACAAFGFPSEQFFTPNVIHD